MYSVSVNIVYLLGFYSAPSLPPFLPQKPVHFSSMCFEREETSMVNIRDDGPQRNVRRGGGEKELDRLTKGLTVYLQDRTSTLVDQGFWSNSVRLFPKAVLLISSVKNFFTITEGDLHTQKAK